MHKFLKIFLEKPALELSVRPWHYWIIFFIFMLLIPYPLFHGLDALVLRIWDESRRGVNAYEMLHNGNLLISYYDGKPDMWGTKPTLMVALQTGFMWLLGPGELAVRLPSAISGLVTCLLFIYFSAKYLKNPYFGLIWAGVLITFNGYVDFHGTRTGDFDALLTLFMFAYAMFFFLYSEKKEEKYLLYTAVFLTLSVMTKGVAGLLFMPGLFIWAIYKRSLKEIISNKQTWIGAGIFIVVVGGYYISRELANPGYFKAVAENELGGRYLSSIEGHNQPYSFFIDLIFSSQLKKWAFFILPGLVAGFFMKERTAKDLHLISVILIITHLIIISFSKTKIFWYDLPEFPFIALLVSNFTWYILFALYRPYKHYKKLPLKLLPLIFVVAVFYEPVRITYKEAFWIQERPWYLPDHEIAIFLRQGVRGQRQLDGYVLVNEDYNSPSLFYKYLLKDKGQVVNFKSKDNLSPGDHVIAYESLAKDFIEKNYNAEILESWEYVRVYAIR